MTLSNGFACSFPQYGHGANSGITRSFRHVRGLFVRTIAVRAPFAICYAMFALLAKFTLGQRLDYFVGLWPKSKGRVENTAEILGVITHQVVLPRRKPTKGGNLTSIEKELDALAGDLVRPRSFHTAPPFFSRSMSRRPSRSLRGNLDFR